MIGIYTRLSITDDLSNSLDNQINEGVAYAKLNGYSEEQIIYYNEGSGIKGSASIEKRPELFRLIQDVKEGKLKIVYVRKQNRLARKLLIIDTLFNIFNDNDTNLFIADRGLINFNDPIMKMVIQIMGALDELAPNEQSESTKRALDVKLKNGEIWGAIPYGYNKGKDHKPIIIKDEAIIIKRIFNDSLKGIGATTIAKKLNEDGIKTKSQNLLANKYNDKEFAKYRDNSNKTYHTKIDRTKQKWTPSTVYCMLTNSFYMGERIYNKTVQPVPAIITRKLYNDVQDNFSKNRNSSGKAVDHQYLLKGLLICSKCGRPYNGNRRFNKRESKRTKYVGNFYACATKRRPNLTCDNKGVNITKLESFIIKHLFKNKELISYLNKIDKVDDVSVKLKETLLSLKTQKKTKTNLLNKYENELFTDGLSDSFKQRLRPKLNQLDEDLKGIETKIKNLEEQLKTFNTETKFHNVEEHINNYSNQWDFTQYKTAIHSIIDNIKILGELDLNNKPFTKILIKYKGFSEHSTFMVNDKYSLKWYWLSNTYSEPTKEDMIDDLRIYINTIDKEIEDGNIIVDNNKPLFKKYSLIKGYEKITDDSKLIELYNLIKNEDDIYNGDVTNFLTVLEKEDIVEF